MMQSQQAAAAAASSSTGFTNPLGTSTASANESTVAMLTVVRTVGYTAAGILRTLNPIAGINSTKALTMNAKREVFKLLDVRAYNRPANSDEAMRRIRANLAFFKLTYAAVSFFLFLIVSFFVRREKD